MEEKCGKFINMIKEVRINVSLIDVLVGMPNYKKFLKELVSNKNKLEEISASFLNEECSAIELNYYVCLAEPWCKYQPYAILTVCKTLRRHSDAVVGNRLGRLDHGLTEF
ncbi:hypothetical protein Tco_1548744 [Tanacetum coccineum]